MFGSFLITVREGIEAALVIGIILAYLTRTGNRFGFKPVWIGTALGVLASLAAGVIVYLVAGGLTSPAEEIFEGSAMLLAVGMLTWMIFWMRKQSVNIKKHLQTQVQSALSGRSSLALVLIAFLAVVREGIETVLFLFAATRTAESPLASTIGGFLGLITAVIIGYAVYKSTSWFNMRQFFNATSIILILFAAGLLAHGIHEFNEVGVIPSVIDHVWDVNNLIPEKATFGRFLTALLGYNANPSLTEIIAYAAYMAATLSAYFNLGNIGRQARLEPQRG
ncbi:MAG: iron uptake transporter permease EfeU [Dehalococcoidales bacterium]|nr:iron uptake transporter permease EfeU [Dehalococcoidales bacterium]